MLANRGARIKAFVAAALGLAVAAAGPAQARSDAIAAPGGALPGGAPPAAVTGPIRLRPAARLSASSVRALLRGRGYTNIGKVSRTIASVGAVTFVSVYKVRARDRWGRRAELFVDPSTATVLKKKIDPRIPLSAIKRLLGRNGYSNITKVTFRRNLYTVRARDLFGRQVKLVFDPVSATILKKTIYR